MRAIVAGSIVLAILVGGVVVGSGWWSQTSQAAARQESARNLQQWGIALNLYLSENSNQLPEVGQLPISAEQSAAWYNALPPYISKRPLGELEPGERPQPGRPSMWIHPASKAKRLWDENLVPFHYAMNRDLQPDKAADPFRIYEIHLPGEVAFLFEVDGFEPSAGPDAVALFGAENEPDALTNILFCDGHVEAVKLMEIAAEVEAESASLSATTAGFDSGKK